MLTQHLLLVTLDADTPERAEYLHSLVVAALQPIDGARVTQSMVAAIPFPLTVST